MEKSSKSGGDLIIRPPVVVILGHVDHGKTKILDFIRKTKIAEGEAGGITQHIGAYQVEFASSVSGLEPKKITFLDTPGHEAFTAIRSRGAKVADIGILVVAADEGIKPQTKEAIKILQELNMPFAIAINKIDKPEANSQKVKQELSENNILIEEWGGKMPAVEVSAKTGQGINELLEMILLMAEMEELSADPHSHAKGVVIESHLDNKRGNVATLLVLDGNLNSGDWIIAGNTHCKIKGIEDFLGRAIKEASASQPVVVLGWNSSPSLGQAFEAVSSRKEMEQKVQVNQGIGKTDLFIQANDPEKENKKTLNLVVKADVFSSLEAIEHALKTIKSDEVKYRVVQYGIGNVSDGDIKAAIPSGALVVGFRTKADRAAETIAEKEKIEILTFDIIYELIEKVREKMEEMLDPEINKIPLGKIKILAIFKKDDRSQIIGGKVTSGKIKRGAMVDVLRDGALLIEGRIAQLQHSKAEVEEVKEGLECGMKFEMRKGSASPMLPIREGDVLEIYEEERIKKHLG